MIQEKSNKIMTHTRYSTLIGAMFVVIFLFPSFCLSQDLDNSISSIHNPKELAKWLSSEFVYEWGICDDWKSPQEMIDSKRGDCEDFATLASMVLKHLNIPNDIIIIKFEDLKTKHAICIWKEEDNLYSFISNQELFRTKKGTVEEAIGKFYPDWEKIIFANDKKEFGKIIKREKYKPLLTNSSEL